MRVTQLISQLKVDAQEVPGVKISIDLDPLAWNSFIEDDWTAEAVEGTDYVIYDGVLVRRVP